MSFQDQVVIVTGGSTGIGKTIAEAFAREHAQVVIVGRRQGQLRAASEALGANVNWQQADVSQRS